MPLSPPLCLYAFFEYRNQSGNDYTTVITVDIPQAYSPPNPTAPFTPSYYTASNIAVGMYATSNLNGKIFRVKSIVSPATQTPTGGTTVTVILEDINGFNKQIDTSGRGYGNPDLSNGYVFELNDNGIPALTAVNNAPTVTFPDSVLGRFVYDQPAAIQSVGEQFFIAGGENGILVTSQNGVNWVTRTSQLTFPINCISWNGVTWIAGSTGVFAGIGGLVTTSNDGINWIERFTSLTSVNAIAWNGYLWVTGGIVNSTGTGGALATSSDGISWTTRTCPLTGGVNAIAWNGTVFVAGGTIGAAGAIAVSPDGINWTTRTCPITTAVNAVAWNGTQFVAVGTSGATGAIATSPDGNTWTSRTLPSNGLTTNALTVAYNGTTWLIGGTGGTSGVIATSSNGINWTARTSPLTSCRSISWNGNVWVAVGANGAVGVIATSSNGINWTAVSSNPFASISTGRCVASRRVLPYIGIQSRVDTFPGLQVYGLSDSNTTARPAIATGSTVPVYEVRPRTALGDDGFIRIRAGGTSATNTASYIDVSGSSSVSDMTRNIVLGTSGTERMRINASGNVGIGTNAPGCKLQIIDTPDTLSLGTPSSSTHLSVLDGVTIIDNATSDSVLAEIGSHSRVIGYYNAIYKYQLGFQGVGSVGGGNFVINAVPVASNTYNADGTPLNRLTIRHDGNVGIGKTIPISGVKLDVNGNIAADNAENIQYITTNSTVSVPSGYTKAHITLVGAGGGGGGQSGTNPGGGGGGGAGWVVEQLLTTLSTMTITIGTGGAGSATGVGGAGGSSTIVLTDPGTIIAPGGSGGQPNNGVSGGAGGAGYYGGGGGGGGSSGAFGPGGVGIILSGSAGTAGTVGNGGAGGSGGANNRGGAAFFGSGGGGSGGGPAGGAATGATAPTGGPGCGGGGRAAGLATSAGAGGNGYAIIRFLR